MLETYLRVMGDGNIEHAEAIEEVDVEQRARDKVAREISEIRRRRTKTEKKRFLSNKEDYVLFAGIGYGLLFALVLFGMSSGIFGSSTTLDHKASETFLDTGEECEDIEDTPWIHIFPENDFQLLRLPRFFIRFFRKFLLYRPIRKIFGR